MQQSPKNRINAFILILVFSLNTIAGFACSVGIEMGYDSKHHKHNEAKEITNHQHDSGQNHQQGDCFQNPIKYGSNLKEAENDCCSNQVTHFALLDKSIPFNNYNLNAPIHGFFANNCFFVFNYHGKFLTEPRFLLFRRSCSTYHTDIRIAIQSFQI